MEETINLNAMIKTKKRIYMWYKVRELRQQNLSLSQISRELGLNRATVRRYLKINEDEFHKRIEQGRNLPKKLSKYLGYIKGELQRQPFLSAAQIEDRLKEHYQDLPLVHSKTVYNFVQLVRFQYSISKPKIDGQRDFGQVPPVPYGEQGQVDFGEYFMRAGSDSRMKVYFFVMVLSRSRYKFVYFQNTPFKAQDAVYAHLLAFEHFQGIPRKIIYDQDSVFIHDENLGDYLLTHDFGSFVNSQPFEAVFCRKADPQSKGKVENVVGYVKKNFLRGRLYHDVFCLNQEALSWLTRTANAKVHGTTFKIPAEEWEAEKLHLHKLTEKAIKPDIGFTTYNVRKDNTILYRSNFYTLPLGTYQGRKTTILLSEEEGQLNLYTMDKVLLASHSVSAAKGELVSNFDHKRDKSNSSAQKHQQVYLLLGSNQKATLYLDMLRKNKPRYYHDNLRAIIKGTKNISDEFILQSLTFCLENNLYNGSKFCEVAIKYQKMQQQGINPKVNIAVTETEVQSDSMDMSVQTSKIKTYENLISSWSR